MNDPDPNEIVIKVTTKDKKHCYYTHFTRDTHTLVGVYEYKAIYQPYGTVTARVREVVDAARTKIDETIPATGEDQ